MNYYDDTVSIGLKSTKAIDNLVDESISTDCSLVSLHATEFVIEKEDAIVIFDLSLKMISFIHRYTEAYINSQEIRTKCNYSHSSNKVNCIQYSCKDRKSIRQCTSKDFVYSCSLKHTEETYVK